MSSHPKYKTHIARLMAEQGLIGQHKSTQELSKSEEAFERPQPITGRATLDPRTTPLSRREAAHLLRRSSYGASPQWLDLLVNMPANEAVALLITQAQVAPKPEEPAWASMPPVDWRAPLPDQLQFIEDNFRWFEDLRVVMFHEMVKHGLREKMNLFWLNLLVTDYDTHGVSAVEYRYIELLRDGGLANFKQLVHDVGLDMSMLYYLDGFLSEVGEPNENYARELLELFTMGIHDKDGNANYTQVDIEQISRALTGWKVSLDTLTAWFDPTTFDAGEKTVFGQTGNWGYSEVIDVIFAQRQEPIAHFICSRLYKEFIHETPNEDVVAQMMEVFISNAFEIAPVVQALLASEHFYVEDAIGGRFKSPSELYIGMLIESGVTAPTDRALIDLVYGCINSGQALLNPPNVAGWPGYRTWLTTSSVADRIRYMGFFVAPFYIPDESLLALARSIHDPASEQAVFDLAVALTEHYMPVPVDELFIDTVSGSIGGAVPLPEEISNGPVYVLNLTKRLLEGTPWYEWDLDEPGVADRLRRFVVYLHELPEVHLN